MVSCLRPHSLELVTKSRDAQLHEALGSPGAEGRCVPPQSDRALGGQEAGLRTEGSSPGPLSQMR